jgi:hypothetical protein
MQKPEALETLPQTPVSPRVPVVNEEDVEKEINVNMPPPKRRGTIQVQLKYVGRRKPIPVDFPEEDVEEGKT